jgi:hypothetical protein
LVLVRSTFAFVAAMAFASMAQPLQAAPFGVLHLDSQGVAVVDLGSFNRDGGRVSYDVAAFMRAPVEAALPHLIETRHRKETRCRERETRLLEMKVAMDGGEPQTPPWAEMPGEWTEADPLELPVVCGKKRPETYRSLEEVRAALLRLGQSDRGRRR